MRSTVSIASSLLDVETERRLVVSPRAKLYAVALSFINLFPSGFAERFLKDDPTGYYLSLFLFIHSAVYSLFALSYFTSSSQEILYKVKIFPTSSLSRLIFIVVGFLLHPLSVALLASNIFFFAVLFRNAAPVAVTAIVLYLLLMVCISVLVSTIFLYLESKNQSARIALVIVALLTFVIITSTLVFHAESFVIGVPLVSWCANGIQAAKAGDVINVAKNSIVLLVIPLGVVFIGRRIV
jgi:hypothetical protein